MSDHAHQPGLFDRSQPSSPIDTPSPATEKQIAYARLLAAKRQITLPSPLLLDRAEMSAWIDKVKAGRPAGRFSNYPSAKQVHFAERIARLKRRQIPDECFRDRTMMSRWIDGNKPR